MVVQTFYPLKLPNSINSKWECSIALCTQTLFESITSLNLEFALFHFSASIHYPECCIVKAVGNDVTCSDFSVPSNCSRMIA